MRSLDFDRQFLEVTSERAEMLLGKDFRRCHEGNLISVIDRDEHRKECDDRFSAADIALEETVHRSRRFHVPRNFVHDATLSSGQFKWQVLGKRSSERAFDGIRDSLLLLADPTLSIRKHQLQKEELIEFQSLSRCGKILAL